MLSGEGMKYIKAKWLLEVSKLKLTRRFRVRQLKVGCKLSQSKVDSFGAMLSDSDLFKLRNSHVISRERHKPEL